MEPGPVGGMPSVGDFKALRIGSIKILLKLPLNYRLNLLVFKGFSLSLSAGMSATT